MPGKAITVSRRQKLGWLERLCLPTIAQDFAVAALVLFRRDDLRVIFRIGADGSAVAEALPGSKQAG